MGNFTVFVIFIAGLINVVYGKFYVQKSFNTFLRIYTVLYVNFDISERGNPILGKVLFLLISVEINLLM